MNLFSFIKSQISIISVVSDYVPLKRAGSYLKGSCPFHQEKTASFTVSPHKEIFYCFGCHVGGDVITFIEKVENCSPSEAAKYLVERYQLTLPDTLKHELKNENAPQKKTYEQLCSEIAAWCHQKLLKTPQAQAYLEQRNISHEMIVQFQLGYFGAGQLTIKELVSYLQKKSFLIEDALQAHILLQGKKHLFSPFEDRIIFPIKDHRGYHCGFGSRIFKPTDDRAKYYNSHEHEFFQKGTILYGLDLARREIQHRGAAILVEGYTDCIALVQHGFPHTIATLGTACTSEHLKTISRYTQKLLVMYDGDQAGQKAIIRLTELCWDANLELKVITLPSSDDPASFCARGGCVKALIDGAIDIFTFFITVMGTGLGTKPLSEKLTVARKILELITRVQEPLKRELLYNQAAAALELPTELLKKEMKVSRQAPVTHIETSAQKNDPLADVPSVEQTLCAIVLAHVSFVTHQQVASLIPYLTEPIRSLMYTLEGMAKNHPQDAPITEALSTEQQYLAHRLLLQLEVKPTEQLLETLITQIHKKHWKTIAHDVKEKIKEAQQQGDTTRVQQLLTDFTQLQQHIRKRSNLWHA